MIDGFGRLATLFVAISKHEVGGIIAIVVGALLAIFGLFRAAQRLSGSALYLLGGVVIVVIGVLLITRAIGS
jgi:uncharacterized membrane protein YiaA